MEFIVSGFVSGFVSTLVCHPLEFLKVNYQSQNRNTFNFSKGIIINPCVYGLHYSIYLPMYNYCKKNQLDSFSSAFIAQNISNIILNPLWAIRTQRMVFDTYHPFNLKNIVLGYKKSAVPNLLIGLQTGITWNIHEYLLQNGIETTFSSGFAKTVAILLTYPVDTYRTRIRLDVSYNLIEFVKNNNFKNYYSGISFYLLKSVPSFMIMNYISLLLLNNNKIN
jgi:uncharacterized membrane protein (UPF0136 family)